MPSQQFNQPEQDDGVFENDLPTYEDLAAQKGPNSRFGRWKGWVEKRAAERYMDITPEERSRRRARGWGNSVYDDSDPSELSLPESQPSTLPPIPGPPEAILTAPPSYTLPDPEPSPILTASERLSPTHLQMHSFGSRFLPHSSSQIRALLPILGDSLLLIGHDSGLSVLDMFPSGDPETSGPADAEVQPIWIGEGVYQLELLELEDIGGVTPQGVVLALVGSESEVSSGKDQEPIRSLRMYNLASLTSLARWAITQKNGKPLDLRRPSNWAPQQQSSPKRHKHHSSITKGIKSLIIDSPTSPQPSEPSTSYQNLLPEPDSESIHRQNSYASRDSAWDFVDDLPLRWATDFVPLATAGSRLTNLSVLFFELKREEYHGHRGSALLAVATKASILIYETPKGERAFRFVKELYTPTQPRTITFVQQRTQEQGGSVRAFLSESLHLSPAPRLQSARSSNRSGHNQRSSVSSLDHGPHLSLFVTFDKKAGLIRIADAAVGEVEFYNEHNRDSISMGSHGRRSRTSLDISGLTAREGKMWLTPSVVEIPPSMNSRSLATIYLVTRGKQTHVLPYPLPLPFYSVPPLKVFTWIAQPQSIRHRIYYPQDGLPFLQLIGLGELGIEVQELPLSFLFNHKGKGRAEEAIRTQVDVGGDAGFLCYGGQWQKPKGYLTRSDSFMSYDSFDSSASEGARTKKADEGMYAWCRKGLEDWRVFWLGSLDKELDDL